MNMMFLQPVVALLLWTMVMWFWMYATRIPAMTAAKLDIGNLKGGVGANLDAILPAEVQWKAHNYNHLLELPPLFYVVCIVLALTGANSGASLNIAWAYVILRVIHSLVQAIGNQVKYRFLLFALSSLCLFALFFYAAAAVF